MTSTTPRRFPLVLAGIFAALAPLAAAGQQQTPSGSDPSSTEGALFLLLPVGARAVALGRAVAALGGPESAFWNPAGLADVVHSQVVLFRGDNPVGPATAVSALLSRPGVGTVGLSYFLLDAGTQELRDANGNDLGTISVRNHLGVASAAVRVAHRLSLGLNLKVIQYRFACRGICTDVGVTATTYAVDVGVQFTPADSTDLPLRLGAAIVHVGPRLQVRNAAQADPLPTRVRVGAAYDVISSLVDTQELKGWVSVELQGDTRDLSSPALYLGSEFTAGGSDRLALRAGYVIGDLAEENGARVGLGLHHHRFDLSIAKSLAVSTLTGETEPVSVTFAVQF